MEHFSVHDRYRLVDLVAPLLKEWPTRLVEACREARMWRSWIIHDDPCPPYALASIVNEHLSLGSYKPSEVEIRAALAYLDRIGGPISKAKLVRLIGDCEAVDAIMQVEANNRL
ncbi:hypothetical protein [Segnochrobactrum spirostomi]|uniref:hypothetical protein n=1 Tax=Segnochrobactrum spirostomi TaxID=2608987 RepID=UPI001FE8D61D|nr:hypothetical protein [Segnochrobactrum spirostomi]